MQLVLLAQFGSALERAEYHCFGGDARLSLKESGWASVAFSPDSKTLAIAARMVRHICEMSTRTRNCGVHGERRLRRRRSLRARWQPAGDWQLRSIRSAVGYHLEAASLHLARSSRCGHERGFQSGWPHSWYREHRSNHKTLERRDRPSEGDPQRTQVMG